MFRRKNSRYYPGSIPVKGMNIAIFLGYIILGAYFINIPINFMQIPEFITQFNEWIILVGGIFMLLGSIHYFKASKR